MSKTASQIRAEFLEFFRSKGHALWPPSSVVPYDDPTLLFTNAGMNQFKPLFLGTADKGSEFGRLRRVADSQPCIRAGGKHNDLDEVGHDTYHHTFFEMLGNWSFGDYFKRDAIAWAWELITEVWGIDPERLHATYFGGDAAEGLEPDLEARDLWMQVAGLPAERVHPGNKKDNFWEMGDTGPCGPCSEMHIDLTPDKSGAKLVNAGDERVIEFWNLVFIQFNRGSDGKLTPLPAKHVDTGMGFERIARIVQGKRSNYDVDVFTPIFEAIQRVSGAAKYAGLMEGDEGTEGRGDEVMRDVAYRVIADHIRTLTFAIADGCVPDKDGRGFVLRRILRRAVRYGWQYLGLKRPFLCEVSRTVVDVMRDAFPHLVARTPGRPHIDPARISEILRDEEESFARTLDRGIALFEDAGNRAKREHHGEIRGEDAFRLHDTYGFPIDLTQIMAQERGFRVDIGEYERLMEAAREKARTGGEAASDPYAELSARPPNPRRCDDSAKYDTMECEARLTWMAVEGDAQAGAGSLVAFTTNRTCFYAEQGGQVGDVGIATSDGVRVEIDRVERYQDAIIHFGRVVGGALDPTIPMRLGVDAARRASIMSNHTATHVLNWALRDVLDRAADGAFAGHLQQKGSLVDAEKTRFDFSHAKALANDEIERIEALVGEQIARALPVYADYKAQADARRINTLRAVFGEKYPDTVRVVSIGVPVDELLATPDNSEWMNYSVEFCGGTHVKNTSEIGAFAIVAEESVAKGVRRVVGVTGEAARAAIENGRRLLAELEHARTGAPSNPLPRGAGSAGTPVVKSGASFELTASVAELQKAVAETPMRVVDRHILREGLAELQEMSRKQQKQAAAASAGSFTERAPELLAGATKHGGTSVIVTELSDAPIDALKTLCDALKQKAGSAAILLGTRGESATLLAAVTDDLIKKGVKAGDWIKAVAPIVEGGGGGPPTMAQAGGKNPAKLGDALAVGRDWIVAKLQ